MPENSPRGFLELATFRQIASESVLLNGQQASKVRYESAKQADMNVWFLEACGGLVGKMEMPVNVAGQQLLYQTNIQLKEWEAGVWYPERIVTERSIDGQQVFVETVKINSFNRSAPSESLFGLDGVELEQGGILCDNAQGNGGYFQLGEFGLEVMTEGETFTFFSKNMESMPMDDKTKSFWLPLLLLVAANFVIFGAYWWYRRKVNRFANNN